MVKPTVNENVVTNRAALEISSLMSCKDERIFVHVKHASREHAHIMINTVDRDVVVTVTVNCHPLVPLNELWI